MGLRISILTLFCVATMAVSSSPVRAQNNYEIQVYSL
jgi:hypothetical protein